VGGGGGGGGHLSADSFSTETIYCISSLVEFSHAVAVLEVGKSLCLFERKITGKVIDYNIMGDKLRLNFGMTF